MRDILYHQLTARRHDRLFIAAQCVLLILFLFSCDRGITTLNTCAMHNCTPLWHLIE